MATKHRRRQLSPTTPPSPISIRRVWHVEKADGLAEEVVAHSCHVEQGSLSFYKDPTPDEAGEVTLVRAFGINRWTDVVLVKTPAEPESPTLEPPPAA